MSSKPKRMYKIEYLGHIFSCPASSAQGACRKAFRYWLREKHIKRQPATDRDGGFVGVVVELL